jgi:hypothetical protein
LGLFVLTRDAASKPLVGKLGSAIDIARFDIIDYNHSRDTKSESTTDDNTSILFSCRNIQTSPPPFALHRHSASGETERYPCYLGLSPIARAQVSGISVTGGASQQLLQSRLVIDVVEIGMAHSFIGSEAFLAEVSNTADYKN